MHFDIWLSSAEPQIFNGTQNNTKLIVSDYTIINHKKLIFHKKHILKKHVDDSGNQTKLTPTASQFPGCFPL